jgi:hypothetical protein
MPLKVKMIKQAIAAITQYSLQFTKRDFNENKTSPRQSQSSTIGRLNF